MAKKKPKFTAAEIAECRKRITKKLAATPRLAERWAKKSEAKQLEKAEEHLRKHAKRDKFGAIDWDALFAFLERLINLLMPLLFPTK